MFNLKKPKPSVDTLPEQSGLKAKKKIKWPRITKKRLAFAGLCLLVLSSVFVLALSFLYDRQEKAAKNGPIQIGDFQITKDDINTYKEQLEKSRREKPSVDQTGDVSKIALDELILNAAFKNEAKKLNDSLTDYDLSKVTGGPFKSEAEQKSYFDRFRLPDQKYALINIENNAYKLKFSDKLLLKKELLMSTVTFDTPYFAKVPPGEAQRAYNESRTRLNADILPLMKSGVPKEQIGKKADVVMFDSDTRDEEDPGQYFNKAVLVLRVKPSYQFGENSFNEVDGTSYVRGDVGKFEDIDDKIQNLKKVGDTTDVFTSKIGAFVVIRLESKTGGAYNSWTEFLDTYKKEYVNGQLDITGLLNREVGSSINAMLSGLSSVGLEKAYALAPGIDCGGLHHADFTVVARDTTQAGLGLLSGARIGYYRNPAGVSASGTPYSNLCGPNGSHANTWGGKPYTATAVSAATTGDEHPTHTWSPSGDPNQNDNTIHDSCWNANPKDTSQGNYWNVISHPPGYATAGYQSGDTGEPFNPGTPDGNVYSIEGPFVASFTSPVEQGWPDWTPEQTNGDEQFIVLRYQDTAPPNIPPEGLLNGLSANCDFLNLRAYDQGFGTNFRVKRINSSGVGTTDVITQTPSPDTGYHNYPVSLAYAFSVYNPITFRLEAQDSTTGAWHLVDEKEYPCTPGGGGPPPPPPPPAPPTFETHVECGGIRLKNLSDPQDVNGYGVMIFASFFQRNPNNTYSEVNGPGWDIHWDDQPSEVFIEWPFWAEDGVNDGWAIHIGAFDVVGPNGQDANPLTYISAGVDSACYYANCSLDVYEQLGGVSPYAVHENTQFYAAATLSNPAVSVSTSAWHAPGSPMHPGPDPAVWTPAGNSSTPNLPLYGTHPNGHILATTTVPPNWPTYPYDFVESGPIFPGTSQTSVQAYTAPSGVGNHTLQMYPDFWGLMGLGPVCSTPVHTYAPFNLVPYSLQPVPFDPESQRMNIPFNMGINTSLPYGASSVQAVVNRGFTINRPAGGPAVSVTPPRIVTWNNPAGAGQAVSHLINLPSGGTPTPGSYADPGPTAFLQAGDYICSVIGLPNGTTGYVGPGGPPDVIYTGGAGTSAQWCTTIIDRPYARFYGGDVAAGGQFGTSGGGSGTISAHTRNGSEFGSGVEFAAIALQSINGFSSASLRTFISAQRPVPLSGLSFANPNKPNNPAGNFAGSRRITDFYNETRMPTTVQIPNVSSVTLHASGPGGAIDGEQKWVRTPGAAPLELTHSPGPYHKRHALYVEGDVVIKNNIVYQHIGGYPSLAHIPNFALIVKGNIYISKDVSKLDGLYVAQPNGASGGRIYTCTDPNGGLIGTAALYDACNDYQLKINGSLIAQDIRFLRTKGTLSERFGGPPYTRETFFPSGPLPAFDEDRAAESINLSPEMYLSQPVFKKTNNSKYDYFVTLPPIL